jgi:hypothetical protein
MEVRSTDQIGAAPAEGSYVVAVFSPVEVASESSSARVVTCAVLVVMLNESCSGERIEEGEVK